VLTQLNFLLIKFVEESMDKVKVIIAALLFASLFFTACGGDKSGDSPQKSKKSNDGTSKVFKTDNLSITLDGDWTVSEYGAHNSKGYSVFSFLAGNSGNIYDDFNQDHEQVGEITKTTVDGMPAVTRRQKFQQNEMKMSRVWLIYDGKNVINFSVSASENIYDDKIAQELVSNVEILHKGSDVKLPVNEGTSAEGAAQEKIYAKPASFPEEVIVSLKDVLSADAILSEKKMNDAIKVINVLQKMEDNGDNDNNRDEIVNKVAKDNGFSDFEDLMNSTLQPSLLSATVLSMIEKDKSGAAAPILKAMLGQNKLSYADLKFTYDHWDLVMQLYNGVQVKK
jgi:hypothetical protein